MKVQVFNDEGQPIQETIGELVCTAPFPSMPIGFWNDPSQAKYKHAYFERFAGIWAHGDFAEITRHQGLIIHGRSDTTLNPGGVRIGTAEIYRQLDKVPEIIDSVVIGQDWNNDTRIVLFVTLSKNTALNQTLKNKIRETLRNHASARHVPAKIIAVPDIPRTINGKTVEMAVRQAVHGQAISQLSSLANPETLAYFRNREELAVD
jgi:acetoacetyl-CoA synthetase